MENQEAVDLQIQAEVLLDERVVTPWLRFAECITEGGLPFSKVHDCAIWELAEKDPDFNDCFNSAMTSFVPMITSGTVEGYKEGFHSLKGKVVDVGGGSGALLAEIVKRCPEVEGINFDLPHVMPTAPEHPRITHVGGNMFDEIPKADTILLKAVLHDWGDDDCVKILRNCRRALDEETGKLLIVDVVVDAEDPLEGARLMNDLLMFAHCVNGKERTKAEWKKVGFHSTGLSKSQQFNTL